MNKKVSLIKIIAVVLILLATLVIALSLTGCDLDMPQATQSAYDKGTKDTEKSVNNLINNDKLPKVDKSLERENLKRRIEFINQADRIGYVYLLSESGQLIREVQVLGKVSSLNSYLTPMEEIKVFKDVDVGDSYGNVYVPVQAPDLDGTYGENQDGIFWFTPDGVYMEWVGLYFYSSERMTFTSKPILMEVIK